MTFSFQDVKSTFLGKITSYDFLNISISDFDDLCEEYLVSAFADPYIRSLFSSISYDNTTDEITFILKNTVDASSDLFFVQELLAKKLTLAWLEPQVKSQSILQQFIGTSKEKYYSQQQHLSQVNNLYEDTKTDIRKMVRDYGYQYNSYLES